MFLFRLISTGASLVLSIPGYLRVRSNLLRLRQFVRIQPHDDPPVELANELPASVCAARCRKLDQHLLSGNATASAYLARKILDDYPAYSQNWVGVSASSQLAGRLIGALLLRCDYDHCALKRALAVYECIRGSNRDRIPEVFGLAVVAARRNVRGPAAQKLYLEYIACSGVPQHRREFKIVTKALRREESRG